MAKVTHQSVDSDLKIYGGIKPDLDDVKSQLAENTSKIDTNFVNVKYPPNGYVAAKGDGTTNDTTAIQTLINNFPNLYFPNGIYIVDTIELKTYRQLIGQSAHETIIKAKQGTSTALITIGIGPVQYIRMENFTVNGIGNSNPNQNGLYFKSQPISVTPFHGGLWNSMFKNMIVNGFDGTQLVLKAGSNTLLPIQSLTFERTEFTANNAINANSRALLVEGQVEQILWNQCVFSGGSTTQGTIMVFRRERDASNAVLGDVGGNAHSFIQSYCGNGLNGVTFERSSNIRWYGGYFENVPKVISLSTSCDIITVDQSEFRTSGSVGDGTGFLLNSDNTCSYSLINSSIMSTPESFITGGGGKSRNIKNNRSSSYGMYAIANDVVDTGVTNFEVIVKDLCARIGSNVEIRTITTNMQSNDEVILLAWNALGFTLNAGGNINVNKVVTLSQYDYVFMQRVGNQWWIKNIVKAAEYR